jgi:predicted enzyme related to lactoylglutathione lyase
MSHVYGKFVWFEHLSADTDAAHKFYDTLFGWHTQAVPMGEPEPYPLIMNGADGIGGFRKAPPGAPAMWMPYLSVRDVHVTHAAALAAGGQSLMPPTKFGDVGEGATLADPTGAVFAVWTAAQGDRPDTTPTPMGDWHWNELMTPDEKKALAFYEGVFGYIHDSMDMGPQGTYYLLKMGDTMRAGLMRGPMPDTPPLWVPYVAVPDCDATAAQARKLGATLIVEPTDIPNVGRFATIIDPHGACIAFMKPFD